jgi:hypothetical protein
LTRRPDVDLLGVIKPSSGAGWLVFCGSPPDAIALDGIADFPSPHGNKKNFMRKIQ